MSLAPDPADRVLDAAADGAFGGKATDNRRAGYGGVVFEGKEYTKMEWLIRAARRGDCLAWGDAAKVCAYYEAQLDASRRFSDEAVRAHTECLRRLLEATAQRDEARRLHMVVRNELDTLRARFASTAQRGQ